MNKGCKFKGCTKPHKGRGWCKMHLQRVQRNGDPNVVRVPRSPGGERHHNWAGGLVTYVGAHARVRRLRGAASSHSCVDCGCRAREWSYDHSDPAALTDPRGLKYSPDPLRYQARCSRCHVSFDRVGVPQ